MGEISTSNKITIYDDRDRGDSFESVSILFENDDIIVGTFKNLWYTKPLTAMIYKKNNVVVCDELNCYYAKN